MVADQVALKAWGNSQGIRIPKKILEASHIKKDDVLLIEGEEDMIIIRKKFPHKTFEERLSEYNGKITTVDFDWGEPVGEELL